MASSPSVLGAGPRCASACFALQPKNHTDNSNSSATLKIATALVQPMCNHLTHPPCCWCCPGISEYVKLTQPSAPVAQRTPQHCPGAVLLGASLAPSGCRSLWWWRDHQPYGVAPCCCSAPAVMDPDVWWQHWQQLAQKEVGASGPRNKAACEQGKNSRQCNLT